MKLSLEQHERLQAHNGWISCIIWHIREFDFDRADSAFWRNLEDALEVKRRYIRMLQYKLSKI